MLYIIIININLCVFHMAIDDSTTIANSNSLWNDKRKSDNYSFVLHCDGDCYLEI